MANTKKTAPAEVKDSAAKAAEVKAPAETKAAEVKTEAAAKTASAKTEKKTEAKKAGRKPAAKKETAAKADKKPAAKKETAAKAAEKKPAAKKTSAKKAETAKPAAKRGRPAAAKAEEKAAPAKRGGKKKQISYGEIIEAARKKALAADTTKIKVHIAANIRLTGSYSANENENESADQFYIDINPETESIYVQPYRYEENTFQITADAEELLQVLKGKKNIYDALSDGDFHLEGRLKPAILFIHAVF